eukprot:m.3868 g.3868  ORF g.3868 m.3868 type:complete len:445 (-) comp2137_c0_seq1:75-1409(-)
MSMFGFPGFDDGFPYGGGYRRQQPRRQQQQQQRYPTRRPAFDIFGRPVREDVYTPHEVDPFELARLKKEKEHRMELKRQMEDAERARLVKRKQEEHKRRMLLQKYTKAAIIIQRAFRAHLAAKLEAQREEAASVITRTIRAAPLVKKAKKIKMSLEKLAVLRSKLNETVRAYYEHPQGYKNNLYFVDQVEKFIFQLDDIQHYRNDFVRSMRKQIVKEAQAGLSYADIVSKTFRRSLKVIVNALRTHISSKREDEEARAAYVIQRFVRDAPKIRRAKEVSSAIKQVKSAEDSLRQARAAFLQALSSATDTMINASSLVSDNHNDAMDTLEDDLLASSISDCKALIREPITIPIFDDGDNGNNVLQAKGGEEEAVVEVKAVEEIEEDGRFYDAQSVSHNTAVETKDVSASKKKKQKKKRHHKKHNKRDAEDSHVSNPQPTKRATSE